MLSLTLRSSRFSSMILASATLAALTLGCQDGSAPAVGGPRLSASSQQGSQGQDRNHCDSTVTIAVNDWTLTLAPGLVPPAPSGLNGQTFFQGNQVIFGGGPLYGTNPADVVVGYDVNALFPSSIASGPICVLQTRPVHHTIAT